MDLYVANMPMPDGRLGYNKLYWNDRQGLFLDIARTAGVQGASDASTVGVAAADFDNDGWQDLVIANQAGGAHLYRNRGDYTFTEVPLGITEAGFVIVAADVNDDGWVDLYTPRNENQLWLNDGGAQHWLKVKTRGKSANHFGVGARIDLYAGGLHQVREITAGDGMTSQNHDLTAHFGLGTVTRIDSLVVRWPHGAVDRVAAVAADQTITLVEGLGINQAPSPFRLLEPADGRVVTEGTVTLRWGAPADEEGDALGYTVHLVAAGSTRAVAGLTEPSLVLDADEIPGGGSLVWTVSATDGHSLRSSLDRFTLGRSASTAAESEVPVAPPVISNAPNPYIPLSSSNFTRIILIPMPTPHYTRVQTFMQQAGQATPSAPIVPDEETRLLRAKLILEEAIETIRALGVGVRLRGADGGAGVVTVDPGALSFYIDDDVDLEGVVDGCADISVVTIGTLIAFGVDDEPILEEVDQANLRKFGPGSYAREDGKWMKPPDWTPPDILGVLERQTGA